MRWAFLVLCIASVVCMVGKGAEGDYAGMRDYMTHGLLWLVLFNQETRL